jgi:hypothetical protein
LFSAHATFYSVSNSSAINQWAANAAAGGGALADIAARPGIVKLLDFLKENEDEDDDEDSEEDDD